MNKVVELFGLPTSQTSSVDWHRIIGGQWCPYLHRQCLKTRKSQPDIAIGTCSVIYGRAADAIIICPFRLLDRGQIFTDCIHLLSLHEPGNELHVVPEVSLPGGSIDYFLVSVRSGRVKDFVGIELQTLDTTGTVWPERQRLLQRIGIEVDESDVNSDKSFGMNWKMTAKTILIQLHHKTGTFEHVDKHLVLVTQDHLLSYLKREFRFGHFRSARLGDPMHIHSYAFNSTADSSLRMELDSRLSTDAEGIAMSLGLQAEANVELESILGQLEARISEDTLFTLV